MNRNLVLCSLLFFGVITQQTHARVASRSGEVVSSLRGGTRSDEIGLRKPRPIPGLRPIESIKKSGFSDETNVDEDELRDLLSEYGIDFDTDETRAKNREQLLKDQYEVNLENDENVKKHDAYHNGQYNNYDNDNEKEYFVKDDANDIYAEYNPYNYQSEYNPDDYYVQNNPDEYYFQNNPKDYYVQKSPNEVYFGYNNNPDNYHHNNHYDQHYPQASFLGNNRDFQHEYNQDDLYPRKQARKSERDYFVKSAYRK